MSDYSAILALLKEKNIPVTGSIVKDSESAKRVFVHVSIRRDAENRQVPSNQRLNEASKALTEAGVEVEFLLTDPLRQDIEAGLRATLLHAFGEQVRNAFMSVSKGVAHIWLEPKQALSDSNIDAVKKKAKAYLAEFNIALGSVALTTNENVPGILACLRVVRLLAPIEASKLMDELSHRGFTIPSIDWLKRRLEGMRRSGKIVWLEGDRYAVSLTSIHDLGTEKKGQTSPDVRRLLALARRGV